MIDVVVRSSSSLNADEGRNSSMDLTMLEIQNSCERELDEWAALFHKADKRFRFLGGQQPEGSNLWILTALWEGDEGNID